MQTAKIFKNGNSQAVRLPKGFQFEGKEVEIIRRGEEIVPRTPRNSLQEAFALLAEMPADFYPEPRLDPPPEPREEL